jgi:hypothetical protein
MTTSLASSELIPLEEIPKQGPKAVTKEKLAQDISTLLAACSVSNDGLSYAVVKQVVIAGCWWTSNRHGRKEKCLFKSVAARDEIQRAPNGIWPSGLEHDHVVPRGYICNQIMAYAGQAVDPCLIAKLLDLSFECLVTKTEHDEKLPRTGLGEDWNGDIWERYKRKDKEVEVLGGYRSLQEALDDRG